MNLIMKAVFLSAIAFSATQQINNPMQELNLESLKAIGLESPEESTATLQLFKHGSRPQYGLEIPTLQDLRNPIAPRNVVKLNNIEAANS